MPTGDFRRRSAIGSAAPPEGVSEQQHLRLQPALSVLIRAALQACVLLVRRGLHQPASNVGCRISFADGSTGTVYRETAIDRSVASPAVLVVCFRLRHVHFDWLHWLFRAESELNTILFAGFPGLVSKLWLRHDGHHLYRGFYQWDGSELAVAYVRALWWPLALVCERTSIHYAVLPGLTRDEVLANPALIDETLRTAPRGWWRPVTVS